MMRRRQFIQLPIAIGGAAFLSACGSSGEIAPITKQADLDALASSFVANTGIPGIVISLLNTKSQIVSAAGIRRVGKTDKIQISDTFHIGSNAKSMLAMLVMRSVELGELSLDVPIYNLLPKLKQSGLSAYSNVTIDQLLSHKAGLVELLVTSEIDEVLPVFEGSAVQQRQKALEFLLAREPIAPAGTAFVYSNAGYAVVAAVLEARTGLSFEQLLEQRLFKPLGITGSFGWPGQTSPNAVYGHLFDQSTFIPLEPDDARAAFRPAITPAGNVSMSMLSYSTYLRAHLSALRSEASTALTIASYQRLHRPPIDSVRDAPFSYALGWVTDGKDNSGDQADWHYGSTDIFGCYAVLQPSKNRAVAIAVNGEKPPFDDALRSLAYQAIALL